MITKEKAEEFIRNLSGLGYVKINTGEWEQTVKDTGSGFPVTVYTCPFCSYTTTEDTPYCPICGGKLNDK